MTISPSSNMPGRVPERTAISVSIKDIVEKANGKAAVSRSPADLFGTPMFSVVVEEEILVMVAEESIPVQSIL